MFRNMHLICVCNILDDLLSDEWSFDMFNFVRIHVSGRRHVELKSQN